MDNQSLHTIVINLYNRPNRFTNTLNELRKIGLSKFVTRLEAKTPENAQEYFKLLHRDAFNNINNTRNMNIIPSFSAFACFLSHLECWNYVIDNNINDCLIIEDDIEIIDRENFLMDYTNFLDIIQKNNENNIKSMFITFNSKTFQGLKRDGGIFNTNGLSIINYINHPFCGTHFYYINKNMALFLKKSFKKIKYQIDIEIGLLAQKLWRNRSIGSHQTPIKTKNLFLNISNASIKQSEKFNSDIQYHLLKLEELKNELKLPEDICRIIFDLIPYCYKFGPWRNSITNIYDNLDHHYIKNQLDNNYVYNYYGGY